MINLNSVQEDKGWSPIKPGAKVPVVLVAVESTDEGHLDFNFEGTTVENSGNFNLRFWYGAFDESEDRYNVDIATRLMKQIRQILLAYIPTQKVNEITNYKNLKEFGKLAIEALGDSYIDVDTQLAIIYRKNSDDKLDIPGLGVFISTDFKPQGLRSEEALEKGLMQDGLPWNRLRPMSEYGVQATDDAPEGEDEEAFAPLSEEDELPFGETEA